MKKKICLIVFFLSLGIVRAQVTAIEEVEVLEITWPSDDYLCEGYPQSNGYLIYREYRLKKSKKVVKIEKEGSYCQGDSEYSCYYLFDEEGKMIHYVQGAIFPEIRFYESGKAIMEIIYPDELSGNYDAPPTINLLTNQPVQTTADFEDNVENYLVVMQERLAGLKKLQLNNTETEQVKEAKDNIILLEASLSKGIVYNPGFVFRKAEPIEKGKSGEITLIKGTDIRVRKEPNTSAQVIGKVHYYDLGVEVIDIGDKATIEPYGEHFWYKIRFTDTKTKKKTEGWIFGAFLVEQVFPQNEKDK